MGLVDTTTCVYQFIFDEMKVATQILYNILSCMDWGYASR